MAETDQLTVIRPKWFDIADIVDTPISAENWLIDARWPERVTCPICGTSDIDMVWKGDRRILECRGAQPHAFNARTGTALEHFDLTDRQWVLIAHFVSNRVDDVSRTALTGLLGLPEIVARVYGDRVCEMWSDIHDPGNADAIGFDDVNADSPLRYVDERAGFDLPHSADADPDEVAVSMLNASWNDRYGVNETILAQGPIALLRELGWACKKTHRDLSCREFVSGLAHRLGVAYSYLARINDLTHPMDQNACMVMCSMMLSSVEEKFPPLPGIGGGWIDGIKDHRDAIAHELEFQEKRLFTLTFESDPDEPGNEPTFRHGSRVFETFKGKEASRCVSSVFRYPTNPMMQQAVRYLIAALDAKIRRLWDSLECCTFCRDGVPDDFCKARCPIFEDGWRRKDSKRRNEFTDCTPTCSSPS